MMGVEVAEQHRSALGSTQMKHFGAAWPLSEGKVNPKGLEKNNSIAMELGLISSLTDPEGEE